MPRSNRKNGPKRRTSSAQINVHKKHAIDTVTFSKSDAPWFVVDAGANDQILCIRCEIVPILIHGKRSRDDYTVTLSSS